uniref:CUB domain-containing protein n=1 Tax=Panagrellus redivivus TaxID=6233 RepID=A0A7E4ZVH9_PANRE
MEFTTDSYDISPAAILNNNVCPPREIMFEDEQRGAIESQRANSGIDCIVTVLSSDVSQVILFTFIHIPPAMEIHIFDSDNLSNPLTDCDIETGKQCFSTGPKVTFQFLTSGHSTASIAPVELFIVTTTLQHAQKLVPGKGSSGLKTWQICVIVAGVFISLCLVGMVVLLCMFCIRRRREKEQLKTMQTCMIYAHPRVRPVDN